MAAHGIASVSVSFRASATSLSGSCRSGGPKSSPSSVPFWRNRERRRVVLARQSVGSRKEEIGLQYPKVASTDRELEVFQTRDGLAVLKDGHSATEALANCGEITEFNIEQLVESLLEEGQSMEDYRRRGVFFNLITEFFREGKCSSSADKKTIQLLVNYILAEDGRSAADYNARAEFFAKSAELFPFQKEARQFRSLSV